MTGTGKKSELLNLLGDVKARLQDRVGVMDLPVPQFILIGKQSVGKSRLIESLAGEQFNFCSGTLGSRRPTVLEFRNNKEIFGSRWSVRDRVTNQWMEQPVKTVMEIIGEAHQELRTNVSSEPVYVRIESPFCVDVQIVDLPGFRDFAHDKSKQELSAKVEQLVMSFMKDKRNTMLCVEQASDASNMSSLAKCRGIDPRFERTILIRNKLDKYYKDLTSDNVEKWVEGFGDLPNNLVRFSLTLPWWADDMDCPCPFAQMRDEKNNEDLMAISEKQLSAKYMQTIGFNNFASYLDRRIEHLFVNAIGPVLVKLRTLHENSTRNEAGLKLEINETDPQKMLNTTRDCGTSFAQALTPVMEGVLSLTSKRMTLEQELHAFHEYHKNLGSTHFSSLPSEDFSSLEDYIQYLRNDIQVGAFEVEVNGGAMFRRLMCEVEIFLRFSDIASEMKKRDVIQARGVSMSSVTWRDVVVKLLGHEAHLPLQRRVQYVGERIKWFFMLQKEVVIEFMDKLESTPSKNMYSKLFPKHVKFMNQNEMIKKLIFDTYDNACQRQLEHFCELFNNMLTSTFENPWVFLKGENSGGKPATEGDNFVNAVLQSFEETKERIPKEIHNRSLIEASLSKWLQDIPTDANQIDVVVDKVQTLVLKTYGYIRSQVCDQVELFAESFFKLPMMRRLEEDMSLIELSELDKASFLDRRDRLEHDIEKAQIKNHEVKECIGRLQAFAFEKR